MNAAPPGDHLTDKGRRTRQRLLEVAAQELLERGQIEVTAVAERAEVSVGLLYRYFASKDGLVTALVDDFYDRYEEAVFAERAPEGVHWSDFERERIVREVAFVFDEPLGRRIVGGPPAEPAAAHADARRLARHIEMAARNIEHGRQRGDIAVSTDPRLAAAAIIGGLRSCLAMALATDHDIRREEVAGAIELASVGLIDRL
ncbi:MAG: TetR/AcrR family transcriptional regulator [Ilumatobacter sp.]|uniref:TetR/AcrR family transcriptional regulator n=1 Tax=Ilumatobacter sp. TaxID=1967498 RepID=UPI0026102EBC|nr:TetR/AcrR family transcriptional regulator [Ilumatobacter sp.]MDJ0770108.1 TetR/AcrR family transcriptional regulator [Ilumatobacter sp.]